jgi:hypothetical protein
MNLGGAWTSSKWFGIVALLVGLFSWELAVLGSTASGACSGSAQFTVACSSTADDTIRGMFIGAFVWGVIAMVGIVLAIRAFLNAHDKARLLAAGVAACLVLVTVTGSALSSASDLHANQNPGVDQASRAVSQAAPACKGQTPVLGAADYAGDVHPIEVVNASDGGTWTETQRGWALGALNLGPVPQEIATVQLVACIGDNKPIVLQTCSYSLGGTFTRYGYQLDVSIYAARTGQALGTRTFTGTPPDQCPETKETGKDESYGDKVGPLDQEIWDYLKTWVSGPTRMST